METIGLMYWLTKVGKLTQRQGQTTTIQHVRITVACRVVTDRATRLAELTDTQGTRDGDETTLV